jgi:hypothetical protein
LQPANNRALLPSQTDYLFRVNQHIPVIAVLLFMLRLFPDSSEHCCTLRIIIISLAQNLRSQIPLILNILY